MHERPGLQQEIAHSHDMTHSTAQKWDGTAAGFFCVYYVNIVMINRCIEKGEAFWAMPNTLWN
jgi:hypothetical protein